MTEMTIQKSGTLFVVCEILDYNLYQ